MKGANDSGYIIEIAKNEEPELWYNINEGPRANAERRSLNQLITTKVILKMRLSKDNNSKLCNYTRPLAQQQLIEEWSAETDVLLISVKLCILEMRMRQENY